MELRRLEYFIVLARTLHFGAAADELHISQPGLSQQIKVLERELGVPLIRRSPRGVALTAAGEVLSERGNRLLDEVRACVELVRGAGGEESAGTLRIAYTRSGVDLMMHELVGRFRDQHPAVKLTLSTAWTSRNIELLESDEVDVAFLRSTVRHRTLESLTLATEELVVAVPADHPLAFKDRVTTDDVVDLPLVHWPRALGPGYYDEIQAQIWGDRPQRVVLEQPEAEHILFEVARGVGIAVLDQHRATKLCPDTVTVRRFVDPVPTTALVLAWRPADAGSPVHRFVEICHQRVRGKFGR
ncbi:LysR family transcriptional regulator [soil metagenome]